MDIRMTFHHIVNCGIGGWCFLRLINGGFLGAPKLLQTLDVTVHVVDLVGHYPR